MPSLGIRLGSRGDEASVRAEELISPRRVELLYFELVVWHVTSKLAHAPNAILATITTTITITIAITITSIIILIFLS